MSRKELGLETMKCFICGARHLHKDSGKHVCPVMETPKEGTMIMPNGDVLNINGTKFKK